ncbi:glycosyltransferase family 4 protein [Microbacterium sp. RD1]|uniref:glycosyltransferase family 4 protein n=1 Tax=Microbacterium sp. RD1 TaxID=3457313 RepID=UPI003FA57CC9
MTETKHPTGLAHGLRLEKTEWLYVWGGLDGVGGTESRMVAAVASLESLGIRVRSVVRTRQPDTVFLKFLGDAGLCFRTARSWLSIVKILLNSEAEVVWTFGLKQSLLARLVRIVNRPRGLLVMARNGLDFGWPRWMFLADRATQSLLDAYVVNSQRARQHLIEHGIAPEKVLCVTSGLADEWSQERVPTASRDVIMVGNSRPEKNHELAVRAFLASGIDATLRVFTDNAAAIRAVLRGYPPELQARVAISEGVRVTRNDYDGAGILLHPSASESLPLTVLEATARGCYAVAGDTGDIRHVLDGGFGVIVDVHDENALAIALRSAHALVSSPARARVFADHKTVTEYAAELAESLARLATSGRRP